MTRDGSPDDESAAEAMIGSLYEAIAPLRQFYTLTADAEDTEDAVINTLEQIVTASYVKGQRDGP
jgi:hypothetical protein